MMAASRENPENIYNGQRYEEWRARLVAALAKNGTKVVLYPNPHETAKANVPQKPDWTKFKSFKSIQM